MNEHKKTDNVLTLIKTLDEESRQYLECYMANAPMWILNSFQILELEKETIFIREKSPVDIVYILVEGMVKAVDYCADGVNFEYMWFKPVKLFGTMEILPVEASPICQRIPFYEWQTSDYDFYDFCTSGSF
ncbi:MAG: hypothetical protein RR590_05685 [Hungatella sp.]